MIRDLVTAAGRPASTPMRLFWIGFFVGPIVSWIRDVYGSSWALVVGVPIVVLVDRWANGPMPLPDEEA